MRIDNNWLFFFILVKQLASGIQSFKPNTPTTLNDQDYIGKNGEEDNTWEKGKYHWKKKFFISKFFQIKCKIQCFFHETF